MKKGEGLEARDETGRRIKDNNCSVCGKPIARKSKMCKTCHRRSQFGKFTVKGGMR